MRGLVLVLVLVLVAGCAKKVPVATAKPFCRAVTNICIKDADVLTEDTATAIEGNNLGRAHLCGKPPKCKSA